MMFKTRSSCSQNWQCNQALGTQERLSCSALSLVWKKIPLPTVTTVLHVFSDKYHCVCTTCFPQLTSLTCQVSPSSVVTHLPMEHKHSTNTWQALFRLVHDWLNLAAKMFYREVTSFTQTLFNYQFPSIFSAIHQPTRDM